MAMVSIHYANHSETIIALPTAVDIKVQLYTLSHNSVLRNSVYLLCMLTLMTLDHGCSMGKNISMVLF